MKKLAIFLMFQSSVAVSHPGVGIVMDKKGNVYYTDLKQVLKIDVSGKKTVVVPGVHSHELYLDSLDNLYGEHIWYNGEQKNTWGFYVWKLSGAGAFEKIVTTHEGVNTEFSFVHDRLGNMYWADRANTCQKITRRGRDKRDFKIGDACLNNIRWMCAAPSGDIYVVDFHDLKQVDRLGHVTTIVENLPQKKFSPLSLAGDHYLSGLCADASNNIYIADFSGRQVKRISRSGQMTVVAETSVPWSPSGQVITPNGDFWLLEYSATNEVRVEKISRDGKRKIF